MLGHRLRRAVAGSERPVGEWLFPGTSLTLPNPSPDTSGNGNHMPLNGTSPYYGNDKDGNPLQAGQFSSDGTTYGRVLPNSAVYNIFDGGGKVTSEFMAAGYGGNNAGRIVDNRLTNSGWTIFIHNSSVAVAFIFGLTTGYKFWRMDNPLSLLTFYGLEVEYNSDDYNNVPVIKIDGIEQAISLIFDNTGGTGSRGDDSGQFLQIGNNNGAPGSRGWDGRIDSVRLFNSL